MYPWPRILYLGSQVIHPGFSGSGTGINKTELVKNYNINLLDRSTYAYFAFDTDIDNLLVKNIIGNPYKIYYSFSAGCRTSGRKLYTYLY